MDTPESPRRPPLTARDRDLGMDRNISRRDVFHGIGALAACALAPGRALSAGLDVTGKPTLAVDPPALTGLRGSPPGSFEVAHALSREGRRDWGPFDPTDEEIYDLVVVGAGLSGLAATHFYRKERPNARVLLLDNNDDFGGHARRNEFRVGGGLLLGYGGSQSLEAPWTYGDVTKTLLHDLGIDPRRFNTAYDKEFFRRNGLRGAVFFNRQRWGSDSLIPFDLGGLRYTLPLASSRMPEDAVQAMPISDAARREMLRLLTAEEDRLPGMSVAEKTAELESISYRQFLSAYLNIREPEVFTALQDLTTDLGASIDAVPAYDALNYIGLPGYAASGLPEFGDEGMYIHHFPDGNASVARMLVREMIPAAADGSTMEDIVLADFDYGKLDVPDTNVRLRLESTVVKVTHDGDPGDARTVSVGYLQNGKPAQVRARHCVLACYNAMSACLLPELPPAQRAALRHSLKVPILYTSVAVNNWRAWRKMGIGAVSAPGSYHINAMLDFPVDLGGYKFADDPDDPMVIHMERFFFRANQGLTKREQAPLGRYEMLATTFETIERKVREQLSAILADGGFDPAKDIAALTVNRWPHGYATRDWLEDEYYADDDDPRYWFVRGRQPLGRVAIANSDAAASATLEAAIEQAHRAIGDLI